jgi:hypothetical protein
MQFREFAETSIEIASWSEPLVADRIFGVYQSWFRGHRQMWDALGRQHCRMWRSLLAGEASLARNARSDLLKLARRANLGEQNLAAIDESVMDELFRVILRRWQGSHDAARLNGMALVRAASTLGEIRRAA